MGAYYTGIPNSTVILTNTEAKTISKDPLMNEAKRATGTAYTGF